jgi:hypothetical protein
MLYSQTNAGYPEGLPFKPLMEPTALHGCPTFPRAYMGRKRWAKPHESLSVPEQETFRQQAATTREQPSKAHPRPN